jgi:hypothetical protein
MVDPMVRQAIENLGSVPEAAVKLKVTRAYLYMVLRGNRQPSKNLLKDLGLSRVSIITNSK